MFKLIDSGDKNKLFEKFKTTYDNGYHSFDFPQGLVLYNNSGKGFIFGDYLSGTTDSGCGCCSGAYTKYDFQDIIYWELYEIIPPQPSTPIPPEAWG